MGQSCDHKYRALSCGRLDAVFPSCVKLVVAKISGIIMRTLKKGGKKMAKAKFQDTLKSGLTGVATVGKKIVDTAGDGAAAAISKGKEQLDKANQKKGEALSSQQMVDILDVCYDKALQGIPKVSKSVDELAEDYSSKYPTAEKAAKALVANHLFLSMHKERERRDRVCCRQEKKQWR